MTAVYCKQNHLATKQELRVMEAEGISILSDEATTLRTVVIDANHCAELLSRTVSKTRGFNVESLLRIHNQMSLCIYQHRHSYDKSALLKVLYLLYDGGSPPECDKIFVDD
jgi:hypothetical protein